MPHHSAPQEETNARSHVKEKATGAKRTSFSETSDWFNEEASHAPASLREEVAEVGLSQLPCQRQFALGVFQRQVVVKALHCLLQTILL